MHKPVSDEPAVSSKQFAVVLQVDEDNSGEIDFQVSLAIMTTSVMENVL